MKATKANTGGRPERQHGKRRRPILEGVPSGSTESNEANIRGRPERQHGKYIYCYLLLVAIYFVR